MQIILGISLNQLSFFGSLLKSQSVMSPARQQQKIMFEVLAMPASPLSSVLSQNLVRILKMSGVTTRLGKKENLKTQLVRAFCIEPSTFFSFEIQIREPSFILFWDKQETGSQTPSFGFSICSKKSRVSLSISSWPLSMARMSQDSGLSWPCTSAGDLSTLSQFVPARKGWLDRYLMTKAAALARRYFYPENSLKTRTLSRFILQNWLGEQLLQRVRIDSIRNWRTTLDNSRCKENGSQVSVESTIFKPQGQTYTRVEKPPRGIYHRPFIDYTVPEPLTRSFVHKPLKNKRRGCEDKIVCLFEYMAGLVRALRKFSLSVVQGKNCQLIEDSTALLFRKAAHKYGDKPLLHCLEQNCTLSYGQVYQQARALAAGMRAVGLRAGDRVGVFSYNRAEWLQVQLASAMADTILVNINPAYQASQLEYCLNKVGVSMLFTDHTYHKHKYYELLTRVQPGIASGKLPGAKVPSLKWVVCMDREYRPEGSSAMRQFDQLLDRNKDSLAAIDDLVGKIDARKATNIQFTSGTTGRAKGATLSHFNILNNGYILGERCKYSEQDNICVAVPLYHCFGMVMANLAALTRGLSLTYPCRGFNPQKALQACEKFKCTSIYGVPTMFIEYLKEFDRRPYDLRLRTGVMAGALCPETLMNETYSKLKLHDFTICYGMTETSPISFQTDPADPTLKKTQTVGRITPGCSAKVVDPENGTVRERGQPGELWVKGYNVMLGYWEDEAKTKEAIEEGWMKSGDLGILDAEGYLSIVGRIKDMIIRGGQNIYPKEVEDFIRLLPEVEDVQVIGARDEKFGEEVVAVVRVRAGCRLTKERVREHCYGSIAHYKVPKFVKFVESFPVTVTGKVQKFLLREEFQSESQKGLTAQYQVR